MSVRRHDSAALYLNQAAWTLAQPAKIGSWFLLMLISCTLVALVNGHAERS